MILFIDMLKPRGALVFSSFVLLSTLLFGPKLSRAGVIVETQYPGGYQEIEIIQGHKEKVETVYPSETKDPLTLVKGNSVWDVYDLDKGTNTEIDYADKSYRVTPYPQEDPTPPAAEFFRSTGKRRKILGYWCKEFRADVESAKYGKWTEFEWVSSEPPGAKEYIEYEKLANSKLVKAGDESPGDEPDGFVLESRSEDYDGNNEGPRITHIESKPLPPAEFEPPAGFVKDKSP